MPMSEFRIYAPMDYRFMPLYLQEYVFKTSY